MASADKYSAILDLPPRRTNQCSLEHSSGTKEWVCGHNFLLELSGTAQSVWHLMDGKLTMRQIALDIASSYEVENDRHRVLEDTIEYIIKLERIGLAAWRNRPLLEEIEL